MDGDNGVRRDSREGCFYDRLFTDDASVADKYGIPLTFVEGERLNIKITSPEDMVLAEAIISISGN